MKNNFYIINCITNLHMGSGDINFNIIDNEVERDPLYSHPIMFSSGVKGALREHFETLGDHDIIPIFGSDIEESRKNNGGKSTPGNLKFLNAELLFLPVRAVKSGSARHYSCSFGYAYLTPGQQKSAGSGVVFKPQYLYKYLKKLPVCNCGSIQIRRRRCALNCCASGLSPNDSTGNGSSRYH